MGKLCLHSQCRRPPRIPTIGQTGHAVGAWPSGAVDVQTASWLPDAFCRVDYTLDPLGNRRGVSKVIVDRNATAVDEAREYNLPVDLGY